MRYKDSLSFVPPFTLSQYEPLYRPFKYIHPEFMSLSVETRTVIYMVGLRYESILKLLGRRIGRPVDRLPLGSAYARLRPHWERLGFEPLDAGMLTVVKNEQDAIDIVNLAKHQMAVGSPEPLFSIQDMLHAYFRSREVVQAFLEGLGLTRTVDDLYNAAVLKVKEDYPNYMTIESEGAREALFG